MYNLSDVWSKQFNIVSTSKVLDTQNNIYNFDLLTGWDIAVQAVYTGPDKTIAPNIELYFSMYAQQLGSAGFNAGAFSFYS